LSPSGFLGILTTLDLQGKPCENAGRKATDLPEFLQ
jgi:hypothetical protein